MSERTMQSQINGLIRLTRWKEYIPFVVPLTILGALLATQQTDAVLDWRLIPITIANILVVAYAFMINDIEDAPDDARDPARAARNPVTMGEISIRFGYAACALVALFTLAFYAIGGSAVFLIGLVTLILSHLYSWRPVRLKAWPITDILSHSLMLSGLLLLTGYFAYDTQPGIAWFVAAGVTLVSVYGQLYNQLRDFDMDTAAGLHNTAILLGERNTRIAMYVSMTLAGLSLLAAIVQMVFPLWLGIVLILSIPVSMLFRSSTDMRGTAYVDASGSVQLQGLVVVNLTIAAWLVQVIVTQITVT